MRQQPLLAHIINVLPFDGEVVDAVGAGVGPGSGDFQRTGAAADDLAHFQLMGAGPIAAGFAVKLVEAGGLERDRLGRGRAADAHGGEFPDVAIEMGRRG